MLKAYSVTLRCAKSARITELVFHEREAGKTQRRFQGRNVLIPDINLGDFTCSAVVDWLDVLIRVGKPTQFQWVKKALDGVTGQSCYVWEVKDAGLIKGSLYRVRFQEPRLGLVREAVDAVVARFGSPARPDVVGMEVSIDFTPKVASDEMRRKLVGVLQRHHMPDRTMMFREGTRPRFSWKQALRPSFVVPLSKNARVNESHLRSNENDKPPAVDATYYVGRKHFPPMWRIMDKIVDRQNRATGRHLDLPEDRRRVRIEVELGVKQLVERGVRELDDLEEFNFVPLQKPYFQFMQPTFLDTSRLPAGRRRMFAEFHESERRTKFLNAGVLGLDAMDGALTRERSMNRKELVARLRAKCKKLQAVPRAGKGTTGTLIAYDELNAKAETALRHLGAKFRK